MDQDLALLATMDHNGRKWPDRSVTPSTNANNAQNSPLFRLATELRIRIYSFVIKGDPVDFNFIMAYDMDKEHRPWYGVMHDAQGPYTRLLPYSLRSHFPYWYSGLLGTCRQIYTEARLLPFELATHIVFSSRLEQFIRELTDERKTALRTLQVVFLLKNPSDRLPSECSCPLQDDLVPLLTALRALPGLKRLAISLKHLRRAWIDRHNLMIDELKLAAEFTTQVARKVLGSRIKCNVVIEAMGSVYGNNALKQQLL